MDLVDPAMLSRVFGPLVSASRERLEEVLPRYQALMAERYGSDRKVDSRQIPPLDIPVVLDSLLFEQAMKFRDELDVPRLLLRRVSEKASVELRGLLQIPDLERDVYPGHDVLLSKDREISIYNGKFFQTDRAVSRATDASAASSRR